MQKSYSEDDFSMVINDDFLWRIREISNFRLAVRECAEVNRVTLLRAGVPLLYAHWEGHVRFCASKYLEHISFRRRPYRLLKESLYCIATRSLFEAAASSALSFGRRLEIVEALERRRDETFDTFRSEDMQTSNLHSAALTQICLMTQVRSSEFEEQFDFIDRILVGRRNTIAHGEEIYVSETEFREISDRTIDIMRQYRDSVENNVILRAYEK